MKYLDSVTKYLIMSWLFVTACEFFTSNQSWHLFASLVGGCAYIALKGVTDGEDEEPE